MYMLNDFLEEYRLDLQFFSKKLIKTAAYVRVSHEEQKKTDFLSMHKKKVYKNMLMKMVI